MSFSKINCPVFLRTFTFDSRRLVTNLPTLNCKKTSGRMALVPATFILVVYEILDLLYFALSFINDETYSTGNITQLSLPDFQLALSLMT